MQRVLGKHWSKNSSSSVGVWSLRHNSMVHTHMCKGKAHISWNLFQNYIWYRVGTQKVYIKQK